VTAQLQPVPTTAVERTPVDGECPTCGAHDLHTYPVLSEGGWWAVLRCQSCFTCATRERWAPLGYVTRMTF
jgi:vanillate/4-hydroxybenzoate decarboxylase subunit D